MYSRYERAIRKAQYTELMSRIQGEIRMNPNHDPRNGQFCSGNGLTRGGSSGIIKSGSENKMDALMRKEKPVGYIPPMPKAQLHRIVKAFKAHGGIIQMDDATDSYLESKNAEAITYGSHTILLRQKPTRASVFEELIHSTQYRNGENDGSYESRLKCEIAAQKKLLKNQKAYKLTDSEVFQTKKALESYEKELRKYYNQNGGM